ncbi:MAG TPA: META domain-containing protein, partial [Nocardioidaceae bacterium]|nr:META domain-containing protein [Nocardioidaceae bacterium]
MDFDGGALNVNAGCNLLGFDEVRQIDDRLVAGQASSTEMGCLQERMDQDDWIAAFLTSEPTVRLDGDTLRMTSGETTIELLDTEVATPDQPLVGPRWRINTIVEDGWSTNSYNSDAEAYLVFDDDGTLRGRTACNAFSADYQVDGTTLSTSGLTSTKAQCDKYGALIEAALYDVLRGDSTIDIETKQLTLVDADGNGVSLQTNL